MIRNQINFQLKGSKSMKTEKNFQKEQGYTEEVMDVLRWCYNSDYNEHKDLSYIDWLYYLKENEPIILCELLEDFM